MNRTIFQKLTFFTFSLVSFFTSQAQFLQTVDAAGNGPYTPQSLISNVFLGNGVDVSNIVYSGSPRAVGYFSGGTQSVGIERGIILTTGYAAKPSSGTGPTDPGGSFASNSNNSMAFDANLDAISSEAIRDVAVYTITFIPTSDTLRFRYCFASEEYPEYSCTNFNDIFGFFIQGPGYPTPTNIAKVPGTNLPVAINNVHPLNTQNGPIPNPCQPYNAQYYNNNLNSALQPVYDGYTDVFTAVAVVVPCQPYTIKLAIADVFDSAFDSAVFLEAKSFGTGALRLAVSTPSADGSIAEGCTSATLTFSLPEAMNQNFPIDMNLFGTATPGVDFTAIPANLFIPAGQTSLSVTIPALQDNQVEPNETIAFDVKVDACNRDTVYLQIRDNPLVPPIMNDTSLCAMGTPITLNAKVPVPTPQPPTFNAVSGVAIPDNGNAISSVINVAGVQPTFLGPGSIRSVCMNINHPFDDDLDVFLLSPGGQVLELTTDNGAGGDNYVNTCFTPGAATTVNFPGPQAPASAAPFTGNFQPEGSWSELWDTPTRPANGSWRLQVKDDFQSFSGTLLDWSITFNPTYEVKYQWAATPDISCLTCASNVVSPTVSSTYMVTATDSYGCSVTDDIHVEITDLVATAAVTSDVACFGTNTGIATVGVNVGGANTYKWSDAAAQTTASANNLSAGTYTVTVSNVGGCSATSSVVITQPPVLNAGANSQNAFCFGQASGTASLQVTGGTTPYDYNWNNGQTTASLQSLAAGNYTVTVTDGNGCTVTSSLTIAQPAAMQLNTGTVQNVSCFGGTNGQVSLNYSGGVTPVAFHWNTGQSSANINNLTAGAYSVTMTDNNGCTTTLSQDITQPTDIAAFATTAAVKCYGESNGELHLDVNGGTPNYTATWNGTNGFTGTGINLLTVPAGDYSATITDAHGCSETLSTTVSQPALLALDLPLVGDTICYNANNGTATVIPSGGNAPFSYSWDINNQTTATVTGLSAQEYHVTVTDSKGCTETAKTRIPQKQELNTYAQATLPLCHNGLDGSATVSSIFYGITPGNPADFTYFWNTTPVQQAQTATKLHANESYAVTITDKDGCTAQYGFTMGNPLPVEAQITGSGDVKCHGDATGWASANAFGGNAPYTWFWSNSSSPVDSVGKGLSAGINRVTITDSHGCPGTASVTIEEPTEIIVHILPTDVKCFGESTGSAKVVTTGGVQPYAYAWWNGGQETTIKDVKAGVVGVSVTDANGCSHAAAAEITEPAAPVSGVVTMVEPTCYGDHNGQILFAPSGGTPPYRYALDDKPFNGSSTQIGIVAGEYLPKIKDSHGCIVELAPIEVTQKAPLSVDLGPDFTILLGQDTQLVAVVTNVIGDYQLAWSPTDTSWLSCMDCPNPSVYSLTTNNYFEVSITDSLGCRADDQIKISIEKPRKVFVPTAFSPNGDFVNDLLLVHGQKNSKVLTFRVYDRWGEMVYEGKDYPFNDETTGWDGNFRGKPVDPGVFVWVLEVEYSDGQREVFKGNTTLIR